MGNFRPNRAFPFAFPCEIFYNNSIIQDFLDIQRLPKMALKSILIFSVASAAALFFHFGDAIRAQEKPSLQITDKHLKAAAANSLWRLKHVMEKEGYHSARVALNVWRSNAIDAGVFDQAEYDSYKKQIYEKSIQSNLGCYERSLQKQNLTDARICLLTWKAHAEEIGTFDPDRYEQMKKKLE